MRWIWAMTLVVLSAALALWASGCERPSGGQSASGTGGDGGGGGIRVVATVSMVGDMVREVAGDRASVRVLMGEGVDPHLFKPTRDDIAALMAADVVFANGLMLEGRMGDTLERVRAAGRTVVLLAETLDRSLLHADESGEKPHDPHVWMDPVLWAGAIPAVRDALAARDPAGREEYERRAAAYAARLEELHAYAARVLATVPEAARLLVTAHDAFGYFGRRYGLSVEGIQGLSTESEAGVRDIERLVLLLVERRVPAVFVETTVADRNVRALIAGAAARGHTVAIGGSLFSDAMGAPGTYEGTYVGMIDHNVTTIARALGGEAPAGGMAGRLGGAAP